MDVERELVLAYRRHGKTLGTAESVTGGLVAARVTTVPGAGDVLRGGVVAYTDEVKRAVLRVDGGLLRREGAVTAEVAAQMARGARELLGCDIAVSTTGFAGPDAPDGMPVGLVFLGVATAAGAKATEMRFEGGREAVQEAAAVAALRQALGALEG